MIATILLALLIPNVFWAVRKPSAAVNSLLLLSVLGTGLFRHFNVFSVLLGLAIVYQIVNMARLIKPRMHEAYLKRTVMRTSLIIGVFQAGTILLWWRYEAMNLGWSDKNIILGTALIQALGAVMIFVFSVKNVISLSYKGISDEAYADNELPTVTIAIPARNETVALNGCIESIISNDYPKMEILVLDDCSQDRTPEIIRDFAQSGVRFLPGREPSENWLAKNQAYDQLADEALGDFIVFSGVDTRFGPHAIRALVTKALSEKKKMISVLPRISPKTDSTSIIQPMRYWWELAIPRKLFNRPPVLSTCWMIDRRELKKLGGFDAVSRSIIPERFFARQLIGNNSYSFVRSSGNLSVDTRKSLGDQFERALRYRYPEIHRRLEFVLLLVLFEVIMLAGPFALLVVGIFAANTILTAVTVSTCLLLISVHVMISRAASSFWSIMPFINYPLVILTELVVGNLSMAMYEFGTVTWKDRNICIPVMHTRPSETATAG